MKKITPCIWLDNEAKEAAEFYIKIFPNSKIKNITRYNTETPSEKPIGSILTVTFELDGNEFMTLNGGPFFKVNEAVSFMIQCKDQNEMDYYYEKLSSDPKAEVCGWLKDKFGVSWQLVTREMDKWLEKKEVMEALLKMKRIDIDELKRVYENN